MHVKSFIGNVILKENRALHDFKYSMVLNAGFMNFNCSNM